MVKEGKSLTVSTPWDETLEPSTSVTEGKGLGEDKEDNKDLLPVIWSVVPESKTQGPEEEDRVRPTKYVPVWATNAVELEDCWSLYLLRNLLNIAGVSDETEEGGSQVDEGGERLVWTAAAEQAGRPCNA